MPTLLRYHHAGVITPLIQLRSIDLRDAISRLTAVSLSTLSVSLCPFSRVSAALNAYCLRMWPLAGVEIMFASSLADETGHKIISKWKSN